MTVLAATTVPAGPPPARVENVAETLHGVKVDDPYRWLEKADEAEVKSWTEKQNAPHAQGAGRACRGASGSRSACGSCTRSARWACRWSRDDRAGRQAPLLLHAPHRQAEPAGAVRARRRRRRRPGAGRRERAGQATAPGRSTGGTRRRTAAAWPTACRPTATRNRCCACATCRPARICRTPSPARAPPRVAWRPDGKGFYYTRYPLPGTVPAGEEKYHRHVYLPPAGQRPRPGSEDLRRRAAT